MSKNWSQDDLADKLGTKTNYISYIENAKRNMRVDYIGRIADVFKISPNELFLEREEIKNHRIRRDKNI